jgi:pimeloyl-ACP methyl ester carboxylesterase
MTEGLPEDVARQFAARMDDRMKAAILPLYRSAIAVWGEWSPAISGIERPGLVIWGKDDPFGPMNLAQRMAEDEPLVAGATSAGDGGGAGGVLGRALDGQPDPLRTVRPPSGLRSS